MGGSASHPPPPNEGSSHPPKERKQSFKFTPQPGNDSYEVTDLSDVPLDVEDYPPPMPHKWKKRDVFDAEKMKDIDSNASEIKVKANTTFNELAYALTRDLNTDVEKIRSIFMWMGHLDYTGESYSSSVDDKTPMGYMKTMKSLGAGCYPYFLTTLCRAAKIPCVMIKGNGKGLGYEIGDQPSIFENSASTWNAVYIDGSWQIVHPTWAFSAVAGHDTGKWTQIESEGKGTREKSKAKQGVTIRQINENYFLPHPDEFIYKCMAKKPEWQLIKDPWDINKFCNVPQFQFSYFLSDYTVTSPHKAILLSTEGKCELEFKEKENPQANLTYKLFFDEEQSKEQLPNGVDLPRCVFFETNENKLRLIVRLHVIGIYKLTLSASNDGIIYEIAAFRLEADEKSKNENMFPANPAIGFGFGHTAKNGGLTEPSHKTGVVITKRREVKTFKFRMLTKTKIIAKLRHNTVEAGKLDQYVEQKVKGNNVSVQVTMPDESDDGEYALQIYQEREEDENNLLNYLLSSRKEDFEKTKEEQKTIRKRLALALLKGSSSKLEKAIRTFEEAELKDSDGTLRKSKLKLKKMKEEEQRNNDIKQLKGTLRNAMKNRNIEELDKAISEAERSGYPELEKLICSAREKMETIEQQEIDKQEQNELRDELIKATQAKKVKGLEEAITVFEEAELPDKGDLTMARTTLCELYEDDAENAMSSDDLDKLEKILGETEKSVVQSDLQDSEVLKRSRKYLQQQKRIKGYLSPVLAMRTSTVAEIQGYSITRPVTQDVMKATLIVLGEKPKELEGWNKIQKKLKPSGNILKLIKSFKIQHLHEHTTKRARRLLDKYTTDDVREVSAGVATFYQWSNSMIGEFEQQDED